MSKSKPANYAKIVTICLSAGFQKTALTGPLVLGDVNRLAQTRNDAAGKGVNVARVLTQLGKPVLALGQGGSNQAELIALAKRDGVQLNLVASSQPLRQCSTIVELEFAIDGDKPIHAEGIPEDGRVLRVTELIEPSNLVDIELPGIFREVYTHEIEKAGIVVISGSMAPGFPVDYFEKLVKIAHKKHIPVILDIRGEELLAVLRENTGIVKINLSEFTRTFMLPIASKIEQMELGEGNDHLGPVHETLADLTEDQETIFIVTRGPLPVLVARNGETTEIPVPRISPRDLVNPIGSGDAFSAGMAAVLSRQSGQTSLSEISAELLSEAVRFGIACGQSNARTLRPGWLESSFIESNKS